MMLARIESNNSDAVFYLHGMTNPYAIPLGSGLDHWGATAPNSAFALAQGQQLSRPTYAPLFAMFGTTYGPGNGTTTFNIPDKVGRVSAMLDGGSARISSSYFGGNPANLGAVGGSESHTLTTAQLAAHAHANTVGETTHTHDAFGSHAARAATVSNTGPGPILGVQLNNSDDGLMVYRAGVGWRYDHQRQCGRRDRAQQRAADDRLQLHHKGAVIMKKHRPRRLFLVSA
jgi:microcystin-dependent protein